MNLHVPDTEHNPNNSSRHIDEQWLHFVHTGSGEAGRVREVILRSWQRCQAIGVNPNNNSIHPQLQGASLAKALGHREKLLAVANPFMADLYAIVKGTGFVVVLTNEDGYILELFSDEGADETPMTSNFFVGASWHERDAGTNAIGTALEEQKPTQVTG